MEKIRLGYVGCGFMAQKVHIPNFRAIPDCDLVALAEARQELGRTVQARFGIPKLYRDHRALLADGDVEAIAVSAGFMAQAEIAREALLAGKHVFMEKPMAISVRQADAMLAAARQTGRRLMVAYMKRHDAGFEVAKAQIAAFRADGELGPVLYARSHEFAGDWIAGLDAPMDTSREPAAALPAVGPDWLPHEYLGKYLNYLQEYSHGVNLLRWFLDAGDNASVRAVDLDDDGYTGAVILDVNGVRAVLESGEMSHYSWDEHTQVYFRDGWVRASSPPLLLKQVPAEVEVYRAGAQQSFTRPIPQPAWSWSYRREAEMFIRCLQTGEPFRSPGEDTRTDVRLFEEIYRAYLAGRGVL
jgi:predicted dehydrogenase